jgi:hypothetical protein
VTDDLLQLAREALEDDKRATPGPWAFRQERGHGPDWFLYTLSDEPRARTYREWCHMAVGPSYVHDQEFITRARTREPKLAQEVLRLTEENQRLHELMRLGGVIDDAEARQLRSLANEHAAAASGFLAERDALQIKLAAMTTARNELADAWNRWHDGPMYIGISRERVADLLAVGKESP